MSKNGSVCRDCLKCMGYCNMLMGREYRCGRGFEVEELLEPGNGVLKLGIHPYEDKCEKMKLPETKEEFVRTAASFGIDWDLDKL